MPKLTLQQRLIRALEARGSRRTPVQPSRRVVRLTHYRAGEEDFFFVGKAGALRYGPAYTKSHPVSDRLRDSILAEVPA
jgi:hypothetical protein